MAQMQPSAAEAHQEEPAGLDFFRCRLRRAAALAPAERPLEVRQLIQAIACIEQVQRLLPLSADGRPASAAPPLQTMALAFAAAAAADAAAPQPPPLASEARASLAAYRPALLHAASEAQAAAAYPAAGASSSDSTDSNSSRASTTFSSGRAAGTPGPAPRLQLPDCLPRLAALLAHYNAAVEVAERAGLALDAAAALQAYAQLAGLVRRLGAPAWQQAADRELATLWQLEQDGQQQQQPEPAQFEEPPPPLTACQLQLAAATALAKQATALLNDCRRRGRPAAAAPQQAAQLRAVAGGAAGTLLQLAPGSPKACLLAAHCVLAADGSYGGQPGAQQQALQLYQRCYELAEPQGPAASPYCAVRAVAGWLMLAAVAPSVQRGQLEAALSAFRQAEAALARCRRQRLLPAMWLQTISGAMAAARQLLPSAEAKLGGMLPGRPKGMRPPTGAQRRTQRATLKKAAAAAVQAAAEAGARLPQRCAHCHQAAVALRRCARCRAPGAAYCSRACQLAAWPHHKLECRDAPT